MKKFKWFEINNSTIPTASGIYAWHYKMEIGDYDIRQLKERMNKAVSPAEVWEEVTIFVEKFIFRPFKEDPYRVCISGQLKPRYEGVASHISSVSDSLVQKIIDEFDVLWEIKKNLSAVSPGFSSPLYIGMAKNLSDRVNKHKSLINEFRSSEATSVKCEGEYSDPDQNFAIRVIRRGFIETNLSVVIHETEGDASAHNVIENILNRINYPILGRN